MFKSGVTITQEVGSLGSKTSLAFERTSTGFADCRFVPVDPVFCTDPNVCSSLGNVGDQSKSQDTNGEFGYLCGISPFYIYIYLILILILILILFFSGSDQPPTGPVR